MLTDNDPAFEPLGREAATPAEARQTFKLTRGDPVAFPEVEPFRNSVMDAGAIGNPRAKHGTMKIREPENGVDEGVQAARAAVRILELLASHEDVGVTEIARQTEMTKPRVYRHLRTLLAMGYALQRDGSDRYARGPKLLALARVIGQSAEDGVVELARPVLQDLHERFDHGFNLSLVYGDSASIVESLPGKGLVGITVKLGEPLPLHSTAGGKLVLADRLDKQGALPAGKLTRFTPYTITDPAVLREELVAVAARGWADAPEQVVLGINAVSAPVYDHTGMLVAMVSAMDSIQFIPPDPPARLVDALRAAAGAISAKLAV